MPLLSERMFCMENPDTFQVEVAYAKPDLQVIIPLTVTAETTVQQVIEQSKILKQFTEIDLQQSKVGIFGKLCKLETVVRASDRVEIYRPLLADPKLVRQQRAAEGKRMKRGTGEMTEDAS